MKEKRIYTFVLVFILLIGFTITLFFLGKGNRNKNDLGPENIDATNQKDITSDGINQNDLISEEVHGTNQNGFIIEDDILVKYIGDEKNVVIPVGVTGIATNVFANNEELESIILPEGLTSIGSWAFSSCSNLKEINLPDSLIEIGTQAFMYCISLQEIKIPKNVVTLGNGVFQNCTMLESVTINADCMLGKDMFYETKWLKDYMDRSSDIILNDVYLCTTMDTEEIIIPEGIKRIGANAFSYSGITAVTLPGGVKEIGEFAFAGTSLTSVELKEGLEIIGDSAFFRCSNLISISLPQGIKQIGGKAFSDCSKLTTINLPEGIEFIGSFAFDNCKALTKITLPSTLTEINQGLFFACGKLTSITIPSSVKEIGANAFHGTTWLKSMRASNPMVIANSVLIDGRACKGKITIPKDITSISEGAFENSEITSIIIPEGVTAIKDYTFADCKDLISVSMPSSITYVGNWAFSNCTSLNKIAIQENCFWIGVDAFAGCTQLESVTMEQGIREIGARAFLDCTVLETITTPNTIASIGELAFYGTPWFTKKQAEGEMIIIGSVLYDASSCSGDVIIPSTVKEIAGYAFNCKNQVHAVSIPVTVEKINRNAFFGCKDLITIIAPKNSYAAKYAKSTGMKYSERGNVIISEEKSSNILNDYTYGNTAIEDSKNQMLYYKEGIVKTQDYGSLPVVDLVALNKGNGKKTVLTQVDSQPFYLYKNDLYYTTGEGVYRIGTDGKNNNQLVTLPKKDKKVYLNNISIIGIEDDYVYYFYRYYTESNYKATIERVQINGSNKKVVAELKDHRRHFNPVMANGYIYYINPAKQSTFDLVSIDLEGNERTTIESGIKSFSQLFSDRNDVFYSCTNEDYTTVWIKKISSEGIPSTLKELKQEHFKSIELHSVLEGYLYYSSRKEIYRLSTDGNRDELVLDIQELGEQLEYIDTIYVKGDWMLLHFEDDGPNPTYCVKLDGSVIINLSPFCYRDSFDVSSNSIHYQVVTVPGEDEGSFSRESVFRRLELPLRQYE